LDAAAKRRLLWRASVTMPRSLLFGCNAETIHLFYILRGSGSFFETAMLEPLSAAVPLESATAVCLGSGRFLVSSPSRRGRPFTTTLTHPMALLRHNLDHRLFLLASRAGACPRTCWATHHHPANSRRFVRQDDVWTEVSSSPSPDTLSVSMMRVHMGLSGDKCCIHHVTGQEIDRDVRSRHCGV
jgi:hypothetical protein